MLNKMQTNSIYKRAMEFRNYWTEHFPKSDAEWLHMRNAAEKTVEDSKYDPLCKRIMLTTQFYFYDLQKD